MQTVFAVDDDRNFLRILSYQVRELGFEVSAFQSPREALDRIREYEAPDVVITDLRMPEMDGFQFLERVVEAERNLPVIVLTAHGSSDLAAEAFRHGAFEFLTKPCRLQELELALGRALKASVAGRSREPAPTFNVT